MKQIIATILSAALFLSIGACGKSDSKKDVSKPPVAVEVRAASFNNVSDGIEVTGSLEPKFSVEVKTQIPGLVRQVMVSEWVHVRKGQSLVLINVPEAEAQVKRAEAGVASARANLAEARVASNRADRERDRSLKLKESGLATQQAVDDARSETEAQEVAA